MTLQSDPAAASWDSCARCHGDRVRVGRLRALVEPVASCPLPRSPHLCSGPTATRGCAITVSVQCPDSMDEWMGSRPSRLSSSVPQWAQSQASTSRPRAGARGASWCRGSRKPRAAGSGVPGAPPSGGFSLGLELRRGPAGPGWGPAESAGARGQQEQGVGRVGWRVRLVVGGAWETGLEWRRGQAGPLAAGWTPELQSVVGSWSRWGSLGRGGSEMR